MKNHKEILGAKSQAEVYDQIYATLNNWSNNGALFFCPKPLEEVSTFMNWLRDNGIKAGNILDVGCGAGRHSVLFAEQGYTVTGIDYSKIGIKHAKLLAAKRELNVDFICADFLNYRFEKKFDVIIDSGCLHHCAKNTWTQYVSKIKETITENGKIFLCEFSSATKRFIGRQVDKIVYTDDNKHFSYFFEVNELKTLFEGFKLLHEEIKKRDDKVFNILYLQE
jgi:2-polyprenyl-3-methyl-5-hydroxy-6-metoxy-1,4-benzoquinol methylase